MKLGQGPTRKSARELFAVAGCTWLLPTATASPPQNVTAVSGAGPILAESKSVSKQVHQYHRPVYVHVPWCSAQPRRRSHKSNPKNKTEIRL